MIGELRRELEALPERMKGLPVDERGFPVPWFVAWIDGPVGKIPEFRAMDYAKVIRAIRQRLCWVCGNRLGSYLCFVTGPMCGISRISSEPPSHLECAQWSARNCPFLSRPQMVRRESGPGIDPEQLKVVAGKMIERNPGVTLVWICRDYEVVPEGEGKYLMRVGDPERVEWWTYGRLATRAEVEQSVASGLPALLDMACLQRGGVEAVMEARRELEALFPETPAKTSMAPESRSVMRCPVRATESQSSQKTKGGAL